jgi:mRNA-degrading endonuclease RelE of RelBE toxin-antitoxin system
MKYNLIPTKYFLKQTKDLDEQSKRIIKDKVELILENPYRFKKIHSKKFSKVFRVRLSIQKKETRLIYAIINPSIILVCLLNRKGDYKDLEKYLKGIKK